MLREQHMRQLEKNLSDAIYSARIAGIGLEEVEQTLEMLYPLLPINSTAHLLRNLRRKVIADDCFSRFVGNLITNNIV